MKYTTSDNCTYIDPNLDVLKKHCLDNGLKLFDENGNSIELKTKKTKE